MLGYYKEQIVDNTTSIWVAYWNDTELCENRDDFQ